MSETERARDGYEAYYAEKLWELLPAIYKEQDGLAVREGTAEPPGSLRGFIEVIAEQAAVLRRSIDRLWEDQYIETCDDWVISYIGELVGTRLLSKLNPRGRRADVAKTIYYRRRSGTLRILQELVFDITNWEGKVVEQFRRLGRFRHRLDPPPRSYSGRETGTQPGGWADLRSVYGAQLANRPFDEFHHTPDFRRHRGVKGRYGILKLAFHLYRLKAFFVQEVSPEVLDAEGKLYSFDPSGRQMPLFKPHCRPADWDEWTSPLEWELPGPIPRRLFNHGEFNRPFRIEVDGLAVESVGVGELTKATCVHASEKEVIVDPESGLFLFKNARDPKRVKVSYHYGFSGEVGAGTYNRRESLETSIDESMSSGSVSGLQGMTDAVVQVEDSSTYLHPKNVKNLKRLVLQAANQQRPYFRVTRKWEFNTNSEVNSELVIEGLWIGSKDRLVSVVLAGDYERVIIRHSTLDPGERSPDGKTLVKPVSLVITGHVENLVIEKSILGPILMKNAAAGTAAAVESVKITDSIIQTVRPLSRAISLQAKEVILQRVTVFGNVSANTLYASEVLIAGQVEITDTQSGCFRFSAAKEGSRTPRRYESYLFGNFKHCFASTRFGDPGYAQLQSTAPQELQRGGEDGTEIGAFNSLVNPVKFDGLQAKLEEFCPFRLIPIYVFET